MGSKSVKLGFFTVNFNEVNFNEETCQKLYKSLFYLVVGDFRFETQCEYLKTGLKLENNDFKNQIYS